MFHLISNINNEKSVQEIKMQDLKSNIHQVNGVMA